MALLDQSLEVLREFDRERYFSSLLLPKEYRDDVAVLYAFNAEIARVRDVVSEPIPGEIRLQWWRDVIADDDAEARANPLAASLLDVIKRHDLPREAFDQMLLARAFDLYNDPLPTMNDFEIYAGETTSLLFRQAGLIAGAEQSRALADCCGHAGVAYGAALTLRDFAKHAGRGQIFVPADLLSECGADGDKIINGKMHDGLSAALLAMVDKAREHKSQAIEHVREISDAHRGIFNLLAVIEPYCKLIEKPGFNPFKERVHLSQLKLQWVLWRG